MTKFRNRVVKSLFQATGAASFLLMVASPQAAADPLLEPKVFSSNASGVLDLLIVAKAQPISSISFQPPSGRALVHPTGWIYEVCLRPVATNTCPADQTTASDYGGVRLQLRAGDVLKIRLVNQLPALDPNKVKHGKEPGQENLFRNPTNLHTHGLIVEPRTSTSDDPTFGDYVFVQAYNSANGALTAQTTHQHGANLMDVIDYRIDIPKDHPSGIFWFHPHIHGLSLNQVTSGLAGIITIGDVHDYVPDAPRTIRHLLLQDMQVLAAGTFHYDFTDKSVNVSDGEVQNQQIADFCEARDNTGPSGRLGYCDGEPNGGSGNSFIGSRWFFTVNGQVFPTIRMKTQDGELWRVTNGSAQVSYKLELWDDQAQSAMPMQLVAIDGISVSVPPGTPTGTVMAMGGNKFVAVDCPSGSPQTSSVVCVSDLVMMPSSRAEIWVTYRRKDGTVAKPPPNATATLLQTSVPLGKTAEDWPQLKLAKVQFAEPKPTRKSLEVTSEKMVLPTFTFNASAMKLAMASTQAAAEPMTHEAIAAIVPTQPTCTPLAKGHHRRIFFGLVDPTDANSSFGLGYEEVVDATGKIVEGTQVPVTAFDPMQTMICLPLAAGGPAVHEKWELINLGTETHNFHIHQTKFTLLNAVEPQQPSMAGILEDNVPVPPATSNLAAIYDSQNGYCTVYQWRSGQCTTTSIVLDIPFTQIGDFVFHCHILEHEDSGMMAKIRVIPIND